MADSDLIARVASSVGAIAADQWDRLAGPDNPFMSHAFLSALEDSGSVGPGTGWSPAPIVIEDARGHLHAALPAYLKDHSQGEYVFDHAWADAWHRAGGRYYPKLQIAAPFTPATGPRLLLEDEAYAAPLLHAAERLCEQMNLTPSEMLAYLKSRGCKIGGVTLGERGLVWYDETGTEGVLPALSVPSEAVVDTNGAGDIFHGAYVYSAMARPELPWREHFIFARAASAHAIQHLGNEASLPTLQDIAATQKQFAERRLAA